MNRNRCFVTLACVLIYSCKVLAQPVSQKATTQSVGRDTPAGAMTAFDRAIQSGDVAAAADSFNYVPILSEAFAREMIAYYRFGVAMDARLGHDATVSVCKECRLPLVIGGLRYTEELWEISPKRPDEAVPNRKAGLPLSNVQFMARGPDGIWRMGFRSRAPRTTQPTTRFANDPLIKQTNDLTQRVEPIIPRIESGQLATADAVIAAFYPDGSPQAKMREAEAKAAKESQEHARKSEEALLAAHFDQTTPGGTIGMIVQALHKHDAATAARGYFLKNVSNDRFILATAKRFDAAFRFMEVATKSCDGNSETLARTFGFFDIAHFAFLSPFTQIQEHGDSAVIASDGHQEPAIWFRKIDGAWKQQLDPPIGQSLDEAAEDLELDVAAVEKLIGEIQRGDYKTEISLRDALGGAMLNSFEDPACLLDFQPNDFDRKRPELTRREPLSSQSAYPKTPAGAMNRFISAVQAGDDATVASCLFLANDHAAAAAEAFAHDYVTGVKFVRAVQSKKALQSSMTDPYAAYAVIPPQSLREYMEDEWRVSPSDPNLAVSTGAYVGKAAAPDGTPNDEAEHTWTPIMHRGGDGIWRIGPYYPQSPRQLAAQAKRLAVKDKLLEAATGDLASDKQTVAEVLKSLEPKLKQLGVRPVSAESR